MTRPTAALLAVMALLTACSGRPTAAVVPDLSAPIASWLHAEYPDTKWLVGGGRTVTGSGGLGGTSMQFDRAYRIRAVVAPTKGEVICNRLEKFTESEISPRVTMITGRSSSGDSFGRTYKADGARGGIVVFVNDLPDGGVELSLHQYEVY